VIDERGFASAEKTGHDCCGDFSGPHCALP
jgi:hypothetical protein